MYFRLKTFGEIKGKFVVYGSYMGINVICLLEVIDLCLFPDVFCFEPKFLFAVCVSRPLDSVGTRVQLFESLLSTLNRWRIDHTVVILQ